MEDYINVGDLEASFEADEVDICDTDMVTFTSAVTCSDGLTWTFEGGDPATSTEQNPTYNYTSEGVNSISLVVVS